MRRAAWGSLAMAALLGGCAEPPGLDAFGWGPERAGRYANQPVTATWPAAAADASGVKANVVAAVAECVRLQSTRPRPDPRQNPLMAQLYDVNSASADLGPGAFVRHDDYDCVVDAEEIAAPEVKAAVIAMLGSPPFNATPATSQESGFHGIAENDNTQQDEFYRLRPQAGRSIGVAVQLRFRPEPSWLTIIVRAT